MTNIPKLSKLTFIQNTAGGKHAKAIYRCECGVIKECFIDNVKRLHTISCGCERRQNKHSITHGLRRHPLYRIWAGIKTRCYNDKTVGSKLYIERGVVVCEEWINNPENFINWALANGWEKGKQIDKDIKARNLHIEGLVYSPEMCSVVSATENGRCTRKNRYIEYGGLTKCIKEWSEYFKISSATFWYRIKKCNWNLYLYAEKWNT